jgi:hypothetical protein
LGSIFSCKAAEACEVWFISGGLEELGKATGILEESISNDVKYLPEHFLVTDGHF